MAQVDVTREARIDEARFFSPGDHPHVQAGLQAQPVQELLGVQSFPRSGGRHGDDLLCAVGAGQFHELAAHEDRLVHRPGLQPAVGELALTQPGRLSLLGDDRVDMPRHHPDHEKADGVGADVDERYDPPGSGSGRSLHD